MDTKPLLAGLIGFFIGGLIVSVAATTFEKPTNSSHQSNAASLADKRGDEFDKAFLTEMIAHHESAVEMAQQAKQHAKHSELKTLSDEIISAQSGEISQMKKWQSEWGYSESHSGSNH